MCNGIPRLLRVQPAAIVLLMAIVAPFLIVQTAQAAATCGDVVINEVLFDADDEWVELYVVNTLAAGTVLKIDDGDSGTSDFVAEFSLPNEITSGKFIIIHSEDEADSQEPTIGTLNIFDAGDGYHDLHNDNENIALTISGNLCEEVYWEVSLGSNSAQFGAPTTEIFTGSGSITNGESIARSPNGPSGQFVRGTTDGLYNATGGQSIGRNNDDGALAVTVGYFQAIREQDIVRFTWQTATETGTAGFNLLAETPDGAIRLNSTLIASPVIDSVTPTGYSYVAVTDAERFFIQEVGIDGDVDELGPFALGEAYGAQVETPSIAQPADNRLKLYLPAMRR